MTPCRGDQPPSLDRRLLDAVHLARDAVGGDPAWPMDSDCCSQAYRAAPVSKR
jgi:hypothetical protein